MIKLVIVESPTKAKTLSRFLDKDYKIVASMGHVRDLPKKKFSVDVEHNFEPKYEIVPEKKSIVKELKMASQKAQRVILATDPDREGEAIAYHLAFICSQTKNKLADPKFLRITFHEITKEALEEALKNPGKINLQLVEAQQARRILDRLVGYKLSPLLWRKVRRGLSAGRVQSVALRLIVEREKEIKEFEKKEYWTLETRLISTHKLSSNSNSFLASLFAKDGEKYEIITKLQLFAGEYAYTTSRINNQKLCDEIVEDLKKQEFIVEKVEEKETTRTPPPPFITSTLQQAANRAFGFSGKKTMSLAQRLYEQGYITYHRTDSFNLADMAVEKIRNYIVKKFKDDYLAPKPRVYKTRSKVAQEAHEAIRPTDINLEPQAQGLNFEKDERRLYELIWKRTVATQMAEAKFMQTAVQIKAGPYLLKASGLRTLFDGYLKLYPKLLSEKSLPSLKAGEKLKLLEVLPKKNFTSPPPRYTEASLIKILETKGIGRPSTYAPIISLIQSRGYVEKKEGVFLPTAVGEAVIKFLVPQFPDIVDLPFTAAMEENLDAIARGEKERVAVLRHFYEPFVKKLELVDKESQRVKIEVEKTGEKCPLCQEGEVIIRTGRFGKFLACSRFPACQWRGDYKEKLEGFVCPECGGIVVIRYTKSGRHFYGCANYPRCRWASWYKPKKEEKKN